MRTLILMLCLATASTAVVAQDAKSPKKSAKPAKIDGRVEIREGKDGKYRFAIYNGKKYLAGGLAGYKSAEEAEAAYQELRAVVAAVEEPKMGKKATAADEGDEPEKEMPKGKVKK